MQLELQMAAAVAAWSTASVGRTRRRCVSAGCAEEGAGGRAKGGGVKEGEHVPRAVGVEVWEEGGHMRPWGLNQSLYRAACLYALQYSSTDQAVSLSTSIFQATSNETIQS